MMIERGRLYPACIKPFSHCNVLRINMNKFACLVVYLHDWLAELAGAEVAHCGTYMIGWRSWPAQKWRTAQCSCLVPVALWVPSVR